MKGGGVCERCGKWVPSLAGHLAAHDQADARARVALPETWLDAQPVGRAESKARVKLAGRAL